VSADEREPLSKLLAQGWEVVTYSTNLDPNTGMLLHCFLLRKQMRAKVLMVRKKIVGEGLLVEEQDM